MKHPAFAFGAVVMTRVLVDVSRETVAFGQDALCGCDWMMCGRQLLRVAEA
ncbi:hypothetical protein [Microbacterium algeriense]|uniref:hypothetical protein n=1 Tax=Microbacterium algeriense TaxID=2615184 RepID=UPI0022E326AA|nr:hypothetical protein [Microbacterium algeriense]